MYDRPYNVPKEEAYCRIFMIPDRHQGVAFEPGCLVTFLMLEQIDLISYPYCVEISGSWITFDSYLTAYVRTSKWYDWQERYLVLTGWGRSFTVTGIRSEEEIKIREESLWNFVRKN